MENKIEENVELLFEQLFGKFAVMNVTDNDKKAVIRTLLTKILSDNGCK